MIQNIFWLIFVIFSAGVIVLNWNSDLWQIHGGYSYGKFVLWLVFLSFTGFSFYCSRRENLFRSVGKIGQLHWGRQIGLDLYIGFILFCAFIGLHNGAATMLIWTLPVLVYGNQATLLYLAVYYESILRTYLSSL